MAKVFSIDASKQKDEATSFLYYICRFIFLAKAYKNPINQLSNEH
jgi:hypothetical protein